MAVEHATGGRVEVLAGLHALSVEASPAQVLAVPGVTWVEPELVVQVRFTEWTGDGRLRHPRFTGLRNDKPATDVVRETS